MTARRSPTTDAAVPRRPDRTGRPRSAATTTRLADLRAEWDDLFRRCADRHPVPGARLAGVLVARTTGDRAGCGVVLVRRGGTAGGRGRVDAVAALGAAPCSTPVGGALSDFTDVLVDDAYRRERRPPTGRRAASGSGLAGRRLPGDPARVGVAGRALRAAWTGRRWTAAGVALPGTAGDADRGPGHATCPAHARKTVRRRVNQIARLDLDVREVAAGETRPGRAPTCCGCTRRSGQGRGGNPEHLRPRVRRPPDRRPSAA